MEGLSGREAAIVNAAAAGVTSLAPTREVDKALEKMANFDVAAIRESQTEEQKVENKERSGKIFADKYKEFFPDFAVLNREQVSLHDSVMQTDLTELTEGSVEFRMLRTYERLVEKDVEVQITIDNGVSDSEIITTGDILRGALTAEKVNQFFIDEMETIKLGSGDGDSIRELGGPAFAKAMKHQAKKAKRKPRFRDIKKKK